MEGPVMQRNVLYRWIPGTLLAVSRTLASASDPTPATQAPRLDVQAAAQAFDAKVEPVREAVLAAQVAGAVVQLAVRAGDHVQAGQVLLRLDARAADQTAAAGDAQVQAARAMLEAATQDVNRQRQLFAKNYISQAGLEQAESQFKATQAQANAQLAQASAARTQTTFYVLRAPFSGIVSDVPVALGDLAMPGRPLVAMYDPTAMRVTASVPQSLAIYLAPSPLPRLELPGQPAGAAAVQPVRMQVLPTVDPATHTMQIRLDLPSGLLHVAPGQFARVWLTAAVASGKADATLTVPASSIVRRAELTAIYVLDPAGRAVLRQIRLGRTLGDQVEVLSGLAPGERVASDPQAAARTTANPR